MQAVFARRGPYNFLSSGWRRRPAHSHWMHTMFRCTARPSKPLVRALFALFVASVLTLCGVASAQQAQRNFPQNALRGELTVTQPPELLLNGAPARLAPGARIKGGGNLLVMSGAIVGQKLAVNYTLDTHGLVKDVWLLREDELARKPWPRSAGEAARWAFDPIAQTWTRP
jgi:hypothetical protein